MTTRKSTSARTEETSRGETFEGRGHLRWRCEIGRRPGTIERLQKGYQIQLILRTER